MKGFFAVAALVLLARGQVNLQNPSFETTLTGTWTAINGLSTIDQVLQSSVNPNPDFGTNSLRTVLNGAGTLDIVQCVDVSAFAAMIDMGAYSAQVSGYINSLSDTGPTFSIGARFNNQSDCLGEALFVPGGAPQTTFAASNTNDWEFRETNSVTLVSGTRGVVVSLRMGGTAGQTGYWDNVVLNIPGVTGDPHFVGFDGSRYNFNGINGKAYALYTDVGVQVNMQVGLGVVGGLEGTWIKAVGFKTEDISVVLSDTGVMVDGKDTYYSDATVLKNDAMLTYTVDEAGRPHRVVFETPLVTVGVTGRKSADSDFLYFDLSMSLKQMPITPHGVLGQTATPKTSVHTPFQGIEGLDEDYEVNSLVATDCVLCTYNTPVEGGHTRSVLPEPMVGLVNI